MEGKERKTKPVIELEHSSYQPSKAELEEDATIHTTFEELSRAVVQDVTIKYVPKRRKRNKK